MDYFSRAPGENGKFCSAKKCAGRRENFALLTLKWPHRQPRGPKFSPALELGGGHGPPVPPLWLRPWVYKNRVTFRAMDITLMIFFVVRATFICR